MKRVIQLLCVLLSAVLLPAGPACAQVVSNTVDGLWQGKIKQNNREYRIVLHIGSTSSLDSPDTGKLGKLVGEWTQGNAKIYLGVLFVRRVDAKVKSGRINLIGFEL